jgi:aldehyde:ferredoxin oxidoreductase
MTTKQYWQGKILRINLSTGEIKRELSDPKELRKYIGGAGIGIKMLYDEVSPKTNPLSSENKIFFCAGPLNGTRIPGSGIYSVVTKGAQTGGLAATQSNGYFGARMRHTGNDIIVIEGKAKEWSYIYIEDDKVEIRSAAHLLGKKLTDTQDTIKNETGKKRACVVCIGPAGEKGVTFAAIGNDYGHVASTNGCGAVMGSKNLKAIAISASSTNVEMYDKDGLNAMVKEFADQAAKSFLGGAIKAFGTYAYFNGMWPTGQVPVKNYTSNVWPNHEKFFGQNFYAGVDRKIKPCWACPWGHCSEVTFKEGAKAGIPMEEVEFEMMAAFTTNIGQDDMSLGTWLANIFEEYGMDGKEHAYCISLIYECFSKGILTLKDTGGLSFNWGETDDLPELIDQIANRRGFGAIMSDGVKKGSERIGGEAVNMAVWAGKGYAPHVTDTRGIGGWSQNLSLAVSDNGAFYGTHHPDPLIYVTEMVDPYDKKGLGKATKHGSVKWVYNDNVGVCMFFLGGNQPNMVKAINYVAGWDMDTDELYVVGERTKALSRAYNMLCGRTREDDRVSPRLKMTQVDGPGAGHNLSENYDELVNAYLTASEYDTKTGKPLPALLKRLDLDYVNKDLWEAA